MFIKKDFFNKNKTIYTLVVLSFLAHMTLSGGRVASALFVLHEGYSELIAGLTYGLYGLMPALLSLHMGRLIDSIGPRLVMRLSLLVIVLGLVIPFIHLSVASILICAALSGLGFGGYILSAHVSVSFMRVEQSSDRTGLYAWLQIGTSISAVTGPLLVGLIIDNNSYKTTFAFLACLTFVGLLWSLFVLVPQGVKDKQEHKQSSVIQDVINDFSLLKIYLLSMSVYLVWDCFAFMVPVLGSERDYSAASIGMILSFFAAGTLAIRALMPWVSRRSPEWNTLFVSFLLAAIVFSLLPLTDSIKFFCALSFVFGLSAGVGHPSIQNLIIQKVGTNKSGEASGLRLMTGNVAGMTGTTACGGIVAIVGSLPVFFIIAVIMGLSSWQAKLNLKSELKDAS